MPVLEIILFEILLEMIIGGQSYSVLAGVTVTSYLPKKRLPLQLQVNVLKSLAVRVTSYSIFP